MAKRFIIDHIFVLLNQTSTALSFMAFGNGWITPKKIYYHIVAMAAKDIFIFGMNGMKTSAIYVNTSTRKLEK